VLYGVKITSMIPTTHYMEEAERLCDYIIIIHKGKKLRQGTLDELLNGDGSKGKVLEFTFENPGSHIIELFENFRFKVQWENNDEKGIIVLPQLEDDLAEFMAFIRDSGIRLKNLWFRKKTLDDLFIPLTGRHWND